MKQFFLLLFLSVSLFGFEVPYGEEDYSIFGQKINVKINKGNNNQIKFNLTYDWGGGDLATPGLKAKRDKILQDLFDEPIAELKRIKKENMKKYNLKNYYKNSKSGASIQKLEHDFSKFIAKAFGAEEMLDAIKKWEQEKRQECTEEKTNALKACRTKYFTNGDSALCAGIGSEGITGLKTLLKNLQQNISDHVENTTTGCGQYLPDNTDQYYLCKDEYTLSQSSTVNSYTSCINTMYTAYGDCKREAKVAYKNCFGFSTTELTPDFLTDLRYQLLYYEDLISSTIDMIDINNFSFYKVQKAKILRKLATYDKKIASSQKMLYSFMTDYVNKKIDDVCGSDTSCKDDFKDILNDPDKFFERIATKYYPKALNDDPNSVAASLSGVINKSQKASFSTALLFNSGAKFNDLCQIPKCLYLSPTEKYTQAYLEWKKGGRVGTAPEQYSDYFKNKCLAAFGMPTEQELYDKIKGLANQLLVMGIQVTLQKLLVKLALDEVQKKISNMVMCTAYASYHTIKESILPAKTGETDVAAILASTLGTGGGKASNMSKVVARCIEENREFLEQEYELKFIVGAGAVMDIQLAGVPPYFYIPIGEGIPFANPILGLKVKADIINASGISVEEKLKECITKGQSEGFNAHYNECMKKVDKMEWDFNFDFGVGKLFDSLKNWKFEQCLSISKQKPYTYRVEAAPRIFSKFRKTIYENSLDANEIINTLTSIANSVVAFEDDVRNVKQDMYHDYQASLPLESDSLLCIDNIRKSISYDQVDTNGSSFGFGWKRECDFKGIDITTGEINSSAETLEYADYDIDKLSKRVEQICIDSSDYLISLDKKPENDDFGTDTEYEDKLKVYDEAIRMIKYCSEYIDLSQYKSTPITEESIIDQTQKVYAAMKGRTLTDNELERIEKSYQVDDVVTGFMSEYSDYTTVTNAQDLDEKIKQTKKDIKSISKNIVKNLSKAKE